MKILNLKCFTCTWVACCLLRVDCCRHIWRFWLACHWGKEYWSLR